jgi:hypothetical protein
LAGLFLCPRITHFPACHHYALGANCACNLGNPARLQKKGFSDAPDNHIQHWPQIHCTRPANHCHAACEVAAILGAISLHNARQGQSQHNALLSSNSNNGETKMTRQTIGTMEAILLGIAALLCFTMAYHAEDRFQETMTLIAAMCFALVAGAVYWSTRKD